MMSSERVMTKYSHWHARAQARERHMDPVRRRWFGAEGRTGMRGWTKAGLGLAAVALAGGGALVFKKFTRLNGPVATPPATPTPTVTPVATPTVSPVPVVEPQPPLVPGKVRVNVYWRIPVESDNQPLIADWPATWSLRKVHHELVKWMETKMIDWPNGDTRMYQHSGAVHATFDDVEIGNWQQGLDVEIGTWQHDGRTLGDMLRPDRRFVEIKISNLANFPARSAEAAAVLGVPERPQTQRGCPEGWFAPLTLQERPEWFDQEVEDAFTALQEEFGTTGVWQWGCDQSKARIMEQIQQVAAMARPSANPKNEDVSDDLIRYHRRFTDPLLTDGGWVKAFEEWIGGNFDDYVKWDVKGQQSSSFYKVIGVPVDADQDQIKKAYRRFVLCYHSDKAMLNPTLFPKFPIDESTPETRKESAAARMAAITAHFQPIQTAFEALRQ